MLCLSVEKNASFTFIVTWLVPKFNLTFVQFVNQLLLLKKNITNVYFTEHSGNVSADISDKI